MGRTAGGSSRRELLAATAVAGLTTAAGCLDRLVGPAGPDGAEPLALTVTALPSDEDPAAAEIGRRLVEHLTDIGVDAMFAPRGMAQLHNDVFVEREYDVFVARTPRLTDPNELRPIFHSAYREGVGDWLNPFGLDEPAIDTALDLQRTTTGADRHDAVATLQEGLVAEHAPVATVVAPEELTAVAESLSLADRPDGFDDPMDLLTLGSPFVDDPIRHLDIGLLDGGLTTDLNPIAGLHTGHPVVTGLVYDPLGRWYAGALRPWAAASFDPIDDGDAPAVEVTLREGLTWHDGTGVGPDDVAFTYRFLADLAGGEADGPRPAGLYAARTDLVDAVEPVGDRRLLVRFIDVERPLAEHALTVPILPAHVWEGRAGLTEDGGLRPLAEPVVDPVGSGPFAVDAMTANAELRLVRHEPHIAFDGTAGQTPTTTLETISLVVPTHPPAVGAGVNQIAEGALDLLVKVPAESAATVVRAPGVDLDVRPTSRRYVLGFNTDRPPCDDPHLRRLLGRLVDRTFIASTVFRDFAAPVDSPLAGTAFETDALAWSGQSVLGAFPGSGGLIDVETARGLFADIGYGFDPGTGVITIDD